MFVSIDTDIRGAVVLLHALAAVNVVDCLRRPELADILFRRVGRPGGLVYRTEPVDEWSTLSVEEWREKRRLGIARTRGNVSQLNDQLGAGDPWRVDCEDAAAMCAAAAVLLRLRRPELAAKLSPVELVITQPRDHGMAHAYCRIGGKVVDQAVKAGMKPPPAGFYLSPETAAMALDVPQFSLWSPRA